MRLLIGVFYLAILSPAGLHAQLSLKARFFYQGQVVGQAVSGDVEGASFRSDSKGQINIPIPEKDQVQMVLNGNWEIIHPQGGWILVPRNEATIVPITLSRPSDEDQEEQIMLDSLQRILSSSSANMQEQMKQYLNQLSEKDRAIAQSLAENMEVLQRIEEQNRIQAELEAEKEQKQMAMGRLETVNLLSTKVDHFITKAKDVKDIFQENGKRVFAYNRAIVEINEKVVAYNEAYEDLNKSREEIANKTATYWPEEPTALFDVTRLFDFALDNFHKTTMLQANRLISRMKDQIEGKGSSKEKKAIKEEVDDFVYEADKQINTLSERRSTTLRQLNATIDP